MENTSNKIDKWAKKMDKYYDKITRKQLAKDLSKSGFKVTKK